MIRLQLSNRRDLYSQKSQYRYLAFPDPGKILARNRFVTIRVLILFSGYRKRNKGGARRWNLDTDFVKAINHDRRTFATPSQSLLVYESLSYWYGLGEH